jgi:hypothetical protein
MPDDIKDIKSVSDITSDVDSVLNDGDNKVVNDKDKLNDTNDTKINMLEKVKNLIKGKKDALATNDSSDQNNNDNQDDAAANPDGDKDVPEAFIDAATTAGWSEQEIADFASDYTNDELLGHIEYITKSSEKPAKEQDDSQNKDDKDGENKDGTKDGSDKDDKDVLIEELRDRITKLESANEKSSEKEQADDLVKKATRATDVLDKLSETFPVFGVFEKGKPNSLPRFPDGTIIPNSPANKARNQVWQLASTLESAGEDFEVALSIAINAFKGANLEKTVKRNLISSLKRSEKKLSAKHSSHDPVHKAKSGADVVRQVMNKYGNNK